MKIMVMMMIIMMIMMIIMMIMMMMIPIEVTLVGIVTDVSAGHAAKALIARFKV